MTTKLALGRPKGRACYELISVWENGDIIRCDPSNWVEHRSAYLSSHGPKEGLRLSKKNLGQMG